MRLTLDLDDNLVEKISALKPPQQLLETYIKQHLETFSVDLRTRWLLFDEKQRQELESVLQIQVGSVQDLISRIKSYANLQVGNVSFVPTPAQARRLEETARFHGRSVQEQGDVVFKRMVAQFFSYLGKD